MHFRRLHLALAIALLTALPLSAQVQKPAEVWSEWETLSPENEEFTVLMPKAATKEAATFPYHKMELNARLYLATSSAGPVLSIVSLSGIKSNPAQYTEFARFNSYVDAFKNFFPAKVRSKETLTKMTLVSSRPFHGHTGRTYKLTIGDLSGSLNAFVTKKRFYAIVSLNTKKDEALEEKFLSSFVLPERQADPPKTAATDVNANAANQQNQVQQPETELPATPAGTEGNTDPNTAAPNTATPNAANNQQQNPGQPNQNQQQNPADPKKRGPIAGGMLNAKAIYLPLPEVPPGEANGVVLVQVLVDEQGGVIDARPVSGPQHLHAAAVNAARLARFNPTMLMGEPVKVSGTLSYNFVRSN
ncbi:MAG TPA: energy transducer TonB [Pyrinomonadaceae bacterium]|nr:energy transducer TonB [Pyrinomonadaceae bacterium]HEU4875076.1 energy transducer TonB [Pyrinomonadaceae bacterium]